MAGLTRERRTAYLLGLPAALITAALFLVPLALLFAVSFTGADGFSLSAYARLFGSEHYLWVIGNSLQLALITTLVTLVIAYPASFAIARAKGVWRSLLLGSLLLPLAASVIVKAFAWTILLRSTGIVNNTLIALGLIHEPIRMIFTETALVIGAVNVFLPFMILPIFAVVAQMDERLTEAAATLGAGPVAAFWRVTVPVTLPGVIAGIALVFSLTVSAYVVPTLLIGERYPTLPSTIAKAYLLTNEGSFGAAAGVVLLTIALAVVIVSSRLGKAPGAAR
ncbi:MAG: ABC transporter permease [Ancalomicrobiaceae bacterium]|nr:ABC transporter permease [Ancalomicrobiaceae bacterium]